MSQTVFLAGVTGNTGLSIASALVSQPEKFSVKAIVRPSSLEKPIIQQLKASGIEIVTGDIVHDSQQTLEGHIKGVDVVIIASNPALHQEAEHQNKLLLAAKNASVKRVIPSDFSSYAPPGSMKYQDEKVVTQEFIKRLGIPYTFIQVGIWTHLMFPVPHSVVKTSQTAIPSQKEFIGSGQHKSTFTSIKSIGEFVARIISDPRTLNQTVQTWDAELTLNEIWTLAETVSGEKFDDYPRVSAEDIETQLRQYPEKRIVLEYMRSLYIRGDNSLENAVQAGALDARVLYPDYLVPELEVSAKEFYRQFRK